MELSHLLIITLPQCASVPADEMPVACQCLSKFAYCRSLVDLTQGDGPAYSRYDSEESDPIGRKIVMLPNYKN